MNRAVYTLTSVLVALLLCAIMVSCGKGYDEVTSVSSDTTIPVEKALQTLSSFNQQTGAETRTQSRQISSVDVTYTEDHTPLAYLVNYSDGKGFAVLAADNRIDTIVAVVDSGNITWDDILSSSELPINDGTSDYGRKLVARLIKNGLFSSEGGGTREPGDGGDPNITLPRIPEPGGGGTGGGDGVLINPLTDTLLFDQTVTYCHKDDGEYAISGCAAVALAIVAAHNQTPLLYVDSLAVDYSSCNALDGYGIEYFIDGRRINLQLNDYFYDYSEMLIDTMSWATKRSLLERIDNDIYENHGEPDIYVSSFPRTQYKLCAAMYNNTYCVVNSWSGTGALPTHVRSSLSNLGYANTDYWTESYITTAQLDTIYSMLSTGKPVPMAGWSLDDMNHSHYWIVDGINTNSIIRFHINWGWGGRWNGWFTRSCINSRHAYSYDSSSFTANPDSTCTSWNHLVVFRYDLPSVTPTVFLSPTLSYKTHYHEQ